MFWCMRFDDWFTYDLFFEAIIEKIKQKRKYTNEPQLSAKSRAAKKRAKQDMVHRMVMISLREKQEVMFT